MTSFTISVLASKSQEVTLQTGYQQYLWSDPFHNIFVYPHTPRLRRAFYGFKESLRDKIKKHMRTFDTIEFLVNSPIP